MFAKLAVFFSKKKNPSFAGWDFICMRLPVHKEGGSRQSLSSRQPDYSFKPLLNLIPSCIYFVNMTFIKKAMIFI